jgi:tetratricopeptide (TPR) repeat protein
VPLRWRLLSYGLFVVYFIAELVAKLQTHQTRLVARLPSFLLEIAPEIAAGAITVLLFVLLLQAEERIPHWLAKSNTAVKDLEAKVTSAGRLSDDLARVHQELEAMRADIRSNDTLLHGRLLLFQYEYRKAATAFEEAVKANPTDLAARSWLGLSLLRAEEPRAALPHLEKAAERGQPEDLCVLGEAEARLYLTDRAVAHFEAALKGGIRNREDVQVQLARTVAQKDPERAKRLLEEIIAANPANGNAVVRLANLLCHEKRYDDGIKVCNAAIAANPANWSVLTARGELLSQRRKGSDADQARLDFDTVARENPRDANLYGVEGRLLVEEAVVAASAEERKTLLEKACDVYRAGLRRVAGTRRASLLTPLSLAQVLLGQSDEAERAARSAVEVAPNNRTNRVALCAALAAGKRWPALQRAGREARAVGGTEGEVYGSLFELLGALSAGEPVTDVLSERRELERALHASPGSLSEGAAWKHARECVATQVATLSEPERVMASACVQYLDGALTSSQLEAELVKGLPATARGSPPRGAAFG